MIGKNQPPAGVLASRVVKEIEKDLSDRRGLRHEWDAIDNDIKKEIRAVWRDIALKALKEMAGAM